MFRFCSGATPAFVACVEIDTSRVCADIYCAYGWMQRGFYAIFCTDGETAVCGAREHAGGKGRAMKYVWLLTVVGARGGSFVASGLYDYERGRARLLNTASACSRVSVDLIETYRRLSSGAAICFCALVLEAAQGC